MNFFFLNNFFSLSLNYITTKSGSGETKVIHITVVQEKKAIEFQNEQNLCNKIAIKVLSASDNLIRRNLHRIVWVDERKFVHYTEFIFNLNSTVRSTSSLNK